MARTRPHVKSALDEPGATPLWLVVLLVLSSLSLGFQLFPNLWWSLVALVDVRRWNWWAFSILFAAAIVLLVALRSWQERSR